MVDIILGYGTYAAYDARLGPQKKAERTRKFVDWFGRTHNCHNKFTKKEIDKMPISEKVMLACLPPLEKWEVDNNSWFVRDERDKRLEKYLLGDCKNICIAGQGISPNMVINRFNGKKYEFGDLYITGHYFKHSRDIIDFAFHILYSDGYKLPCILLDNYKKLQNKDQWLKRFYQKCDIISKRRADVFKWLDMQFYTDDKLNQCSDSELESYNRIQLKYAAYLSDREAQRLAREKEERWLEEEKKRLEEERKLKYDSYVARGIEGYRDLHYEKLDSISVSRQFGDEFFFGGNVLLRWRTNELIETSKNIIITIPQAKKIFKVISKWHEDPSKFEPYRFITNSGDYNANSYKNDMLTAGCHKIAYCEMERMYNEILKRETA